MIKLSGHDDCYKSPPFILLDDLEIINRVMMSDLNRVELLSTCEL